MMTIAHSEEKKAKGQRFKFPLSCSWDLLAGLKTYHNYFLITPSLSPLLPNVISKDWREQKCNIQVQK